MGIRNRIMANTGFTDPVDFDFDGNGPLEPGIESLNFYGDKRTQRSGNSGTLKHQFHGLDVDSYAPLVKEKRVIETKG